MAGFLEIAGTSCTRNYSPLGVACEGSSMWVIVNLLLNDGPHSVEGGCLDRRTDDNRRRCADWRPHFF